ncbi:MAG: DUF420 domain-containing protein [Pirellulaceae bacterium]
MWDFLSNNLPHLTATLNLITIGLLAAGLYKIRTGRARVHKKLMLIALGVSAAFLLVYLLHKVALYQATGAANKPFPRDPEIASAGIRYLYLTILASHILLAITVPFLAVKAVLLAKAGKILAHKRLVKYAYPIWMYVSITGVVVYLMLYQIYTA